MKILLVPLRIVYCLYSFALFILLMLCVTPIVLAASFFGKVKGGNFIYKVCSLWADTWYLLNGIYHKKHLRSPS